MRDLSIEKSTIKMKQFYKPHKLVPVPNNHINKLVLGAVLSVRRYLSDSPKTNFVITKVFTLNPVCIHVPYVMNGWRKSTFNKAIATKLKQENNKKRANWRNDTEYCHVFYLTELIASIIMRIQTNADSCGFGSWSDFKVAIS
jgi:hypothetical protein